MIAVETSREGLELVGVVEAAEILGVTRQRVSQLADEAYFPAPIARLRATPVWLRRDVERAAEERRQRRQA